MTLAATQLASAAVADADMPRRAGMAQVRGRMRRRRRGSYGGSPAVGQLCRVGRFMLGEKKRFAANRLRAPEKEMPWLLFEIKRIC